MDHKKRHSASAHSDLSEAISPVASQELKASEALLKGVLDSSLDGIMAFECVRDANGAIVDFTWLVVNPKSEEITGYAAADLLGKRMLEQMPGNKRTGLFDAYVAVVETGVPYVAEFAYDDDSISAWFSITAVKLGDGFVVTFRDITTHYTAETKLKRMNQVLEQRNRELQDFAYIASHDLQEPLRKVQAFADLLREDYGTVVDEVGQHYLERMEDAAQRMSRLINDLLSYSRIATKGRPFSDVNLNDALNEVITDVEVHICEVEGTLDRGPLPTIEADERQIRQLLQNLISNALKFAREGVRPVISVSATRVPDALVAGQDAWELRVGDNGIGFDEKYLDRIFTPFQRLHRRDQYAGTGMGLAICRRIVERHNGTITGTSTPGVGSTFIITLPARQVAAYEQKS